MLLNQVLGREVKKEFIHPNMSYNNWSNENQIFSVCVSQTERG